MYTFEQKNEIIIRLAGEEHFEKDKALFYKHCSKAKLERDINRANQFTYANLDARMLNELLDYVSEAEIVTNRKGSEDEKGKKKTPAKKKSGKTSPPKGKSKGNTKKPELNRTLSAPAPITPDTKSPVSDNKKKETNGKNSLE